jgi:hypothetical protein
MQVTHSQAVEGMFRIFGLLGQDIQHTLKKGRIDRAHVKMENVQLALEEMLVVVKELQNANVRWNESLPNEIVEDFEAAVLRDIAAL